MFGNYKTLRRLKSDYGKFEIENSSGPETVKENKVIKRHSLRPALRFCACAVAVTAVIITGISISPMLNNSKTAAGNSHDFALTAYAVNSKTHHKAKIDFKVNMGKTAFYSSFETGSKAGKPTLLQANMCLEFTDCLAKSMSSVTYKVKTGTLKTDATSPSKMVTFKSGTKYNTITWTLPTDNTNGNIITVTAKFKDGQTATKQVTVLAAKNGTINAKVVNK